MISLFNIILTNGSSKYSINQILIIVHILYSCMNHNACWRSRGIFLSKKKNILGEFFVRFAKWNIRHRKPPNMDQKSPDLSWKVWDIIGYSILSLDFLEILYSYWLAWRSRGSSSDMHQTCTQRTNLNLCSST